MLTASSYPMSVDVRPMRPVRAEQPQSFVQRAGSAIRSLSVAETVEFIDLSSWNTVLSWAQLAASNVKAVMLRATFGVNGVDAKHVEFATQAHDHGILVFFYHYQHSQYPGDVQASHHWQTIEPLFNMLGYIPVIIDDAEDVVSGVTNSQRIACTGNFLASIVTMQGQSGRSGVYTSPGYANQYLSPAPAWINAYLQHIAHWIPGPLPTPPTGWKAVPELHQYGIWNNYLWCAPVEGCQADIDRDRALMTYANLVQLLTGQPIPPPEPPPNIIEYPPAPICFAKVINPAGATVRKGYATNQASVGSLALGAVVPVFERVDKANGEVWLHIRMPGVQTLGWVCQYYPPYGAGAKLLEFIPIP